MRLFPLRNLFSLGVGIINNILRCCSVTLYVVLLYVGVGKLNWDQGRKIVTNKTITENWDQSVTNF
jgi:hypothetical protein